MRVKRRWKGQYINMDPDRLEIRSIVLLASGDRAEVLAVDKTAYTVQIRYLDALGEPRLVGTDTWIPSDDVIALDMGGHTEGPT